MSQHVVFVVPCQRQVIREKRNARHTQAAGQCCIREMSGLYSCERERDCERECVCVCVSCVCVVCVVCGARVVCGVVWLGGLMVGQAARGPYFCFVDSMC